MIDLARKNLDIVIDLAAKHITQLTIGATAVETCKSAQADGRSAQEWTAVFDMLRAHNRSS